MMNITFLLGSGCEGKGQLKLPSGAEFRRDTILAKDVTSIVEKLNSINEYPVKNGCVLKWNSYSVLYQTIIENGLKEFSFKDEELECIDNYIAFKQKKESMDEKEEKEIKKKFYELYKIHFFDEITDRKDTENLSENALFFLENAGFYSFVDSLFNYLRKPDEYKKEAARVIKLYYAAYLSILRGLCGGDDAIDEAMKECHDVISSRKQLQKTIESCENEIMIREKDNKEIYYNMIAEYQKHHSEHEISVITTNYTSFAEKMIGLCEDSISYVHGRMIWFEDIKTKHVAELKEFTSEDEYIFPFIFIQSGVKPVVCSKQIHELEKAAQMIENSDILLILGYGVNADDEHISNMLYERIAGRKKKVICLNYEDTEEKREAILNALHVKEGVQFESAAEFGKILDGLVQ